MDADPKLFVISGPSGAGKGTLVAELLRRVPSVSRAVTSTTRRPRPDEQEGVHYYFLTKEEFERGRDRGDFLEWALVHGYYYATPRAEVERKLGEGFDVVLVIDVQGAARVKEIMPEACLIFIEPPSMAELVERLKRRETETKEELEIRISAAALEMALAKKYDYVVINDEVRRAANELIEIVERVRKRNKSEG
ncbi:MAG: guanylate kinase [Actinobacteria bacterium]|nr:guanylate kinase [Actinomycetota bacterium]